MTKKLLVCLFAFTLLAAACDSGGGGNDAGVDPSTDAKSDTDAPDQDAGKTPDTVDVVEPTDDITPPTDADAGEVPPDVADTGGDDIPDVGEDISDPPPTCEEDGDCPILADLCQIPSCIDDECVYATKDCSPRQPDACDVYYCETTTGECLVCEGCNPSPDCDEPHPCVALPGSCNDGNPCTDDSCDADLGCQYTYTTDSCDDGNACTEGDQCVGGECQAGSLRSCNDGDPCTIDQCLPEQGCVPIQLPEPCELRCPGGTDGECPNIADACSTYRCDDDSRMCERVDVEGPCDDNNACTADDRCQGGSCRAGDALDCDDSDFSTQDACLSESGCQHTAIGPVVVGCESNTDCPGTDGDGDTGNPCKHVVCTGSAGSPGICVIENTEVLCEDGLTCTVGERCQEGECTGGLIRNCDDGLPCTLDGCSEATGGCYHEVLHEDCMVFQCNRNDDCFDAPSDYATNICYQPRCEYGGIDTTVCYFAPVENLQGPCECLGPNDDAACNDGNDCTIDRCVRNTNEYRPDPEYVCAWEFDGDACCARVCQRDDDCDDGNKCTQDFCILDRDATEGCCESPEYPWPTCADCDDDGDCDDGDPLTSHICGPDGTCNPPTDPDCGSYPCRTAEDCRAFPEFNDDGECLEAVCNDCRCELHDVEGLCDDGNRCTQSDTCEEGQCLGAAVVCDEHEDPDCYSPVCDPATGCGFEWDPNASCELDCTHTPHICDDDDPCTTDTCSADGECQNVSANEPGEPTACQPVPCMTSADCDDGNPCTQDACRTQQGGEAIPAEDRVCLYAVLPGCTPPSELTCIENEECNDIPCQSDSDLACCFGDLNNSFSYVNCEPGVGCRWIPRDHCIGECRIDSQAEDCDDRDLCTADSCDPMTLECAHEAMWSPDTNLFPECIPCDDTMDCYDFVDPASPCVEAICVPLEAPPEDALAGAGTCLARTSEELFPFGCEDFDICTVDACTASGCAHELAIDNCGYCTMDQDCEDGDPCTTDTCAGAGGGCAHAPIADCEEPECSSSTDCAGNGCLYEFCLQGFCEPLEDGDPFAICIETTCTNAMECDDGDLDTLDICDPVRGLCYWDAYTFECDTIDDCYDDFIPCRQPAACQDGSCVFEATDTCPNDCDASTPCEDSGSDFGICLTTNFGSGCVPFIDDSCESPSDCELPYNDALEFNAAVSRVCNEQGLCDLVGYPSNVLTGGGCETAADCLGNCPPEEMGSATSFWIQPTSACIDWGNCVQPLCTTEGRCIYLREACGTCYDDFVCLDDNPCTRDTCALNNVCVHITTPDCTVTPCGPDSLCETDEPCTTGICVPEVGCLWLPVDGCED